MQRHDLETRNAREVSGEQLRDLVGQQRRRAARFIDNAHSRDPADRVFIRDPRPGPVREQEQDHAGREHRGGRSPGASEPSPDGFPETVRDGATPGMDSQSIEVADDVVVEFAGGRVARGGFTLQRTEHDCVQIAREKP